jgi:hypothetical protein
MFTYTIRKSAVFAMITTDRLVLSTVLGLVLVAWQNNSIVIQRDHATCSSASHHVVQTMWNASVWLKMHVIKHVRHDFGGQHSPITRRIGT